MVDYPPPESKFRLPVLSEPKRLAVATGVATAAATAAALSLPWQTIPLFFWLGSGLVWTGLVWLSVLPLDAVAASQYATREDPHGATANTLLIGASVAALVAVVLGILKASHSSGTDKVLLLSSGIAAIVCSWGVVHTVFALRYAGLYYRGVDGGVDFNEDDKPVYADFAYLAFTIGMTYQVSDTDLTNKAIRHTALRHALLSYLLGTVIIAATINLAAGLAK